MIAAKEVPKDDPIVSFVRAIRAAEPASYENLTVTPVYAPACGPEMTTLDEALGAGTVEVTEVSEHGEVPTLKVVNRGARPLLIFDGEELVGAKQNRIVNTTILVAAGATVAIPVSCVEAGRWEWRSQRFASEGRVLKHEMRRAKARRLARSLASVPGRYDADQRAVWDEVDAYARRRGVRSPTSAMSDVFEADRSRIEAYVKALPLQPGQSGLAAWVNGRLVGVDVLGRPDAYAALHGKLVRALAAEAVDAHGASRTRRPARLERVLERLSRAERKVSPPPGLGTDVRLQSSGLHASALVDGDAVVHLAVFPG